MDMSFPFVVVRYSCTFYRMKAVVLFYAVSYEQAGVVLNFLISRENFDPDAHYAIRRTAELYPSLYVCACGHVRSDVAE
jgi:hypothetical protein